MASKYWGSKASGICVVCVHDGSVMLVRRSPQVEQPGTWGIPGGAVGEEGFVDSDHGGEDPTDEAWYASAQRECGEEIGTVPRGVVQDSVTFRDGDFAFRTYVVVVNLVEKARILSAHRLNWENDDLGWFNALPSDLHFGVRYLCDRSVVLKGVFDNALK